MIPYFRSLRCRLTRRDPIFGVLVVAGVYLASRLIERHAIRRGLPLHRSSASCPGHRHRCDRRSSRHLFFYHPEELHGPGCMADPEGLGRLSSTGGVLGGVLAAVAYFRWKGLRLSQFADALALGWLPDGQSHGWAASRCTIIRSETDFLLAVAFPDGARHDLGLYDALLLLAISVVLYAVARRHLLEGRLLALLALLYGSGRFALDFLRASDLPYVDARYLGSRPPSTAPHCSCSGAFTSWRGTDGHLRAHGETVHSTAALRRVASWVSATARPRCSRSGRTRLQAMRRG